MLEEVSHSANPIEILNHSSIHQHILCRPGPKREKERIVFNHSKYTKIFLFPKHLISITYDDRNMKLGQLSPKIIRIFFAKEEPSIKFTFFVMLVQMSRQISYVAAIQVWIDFYALT